ncbi:fimbrillin family protein, partial [Bacteroides uniformis]
MRIYSRSISQKHISEAHIAEIYNKSLIIYQPKKTTKMMKSIKEIRLMAATAAALLLLAGCDKESNNVVENGPVAARIHTVIDPMTSGPGSSGGSGTPTTRAAGTAWTANDAIGITATHTDGTKLLDNAHYLTPGGNGKFEAEDGS